MENPLSYLGEVGFPLAEVHRLQETLQLSVDEIAESVKRMIDRGENPLEGLDAETGTFNAELTDWPEPEPFEAGHRLPPFPLDALPPEVAAFTEALAETTQTPAELGGSLSLVVLSTCFQKRFTVEITSDWSETLSLYVVAVAASGERKSPVISKLFAPVRMYEEQRKEADREAIAQNQARKSLLEKRLSAAEKSAAAMSKPTSKPTVTDDEVLALAAELAEFQDTRFLRLLCEDVTVEKLGVLLDEQNGGITVASDEGDIFSNLMGRYDQTPQVALFLQAYSGSPVTVDRLSRPAIYLSSPRMSIAVTCQPAVLADVVSNQLFQSRGLVARFLFSICKSQIGNREITPAPIRDEVKQGYHEFVTRLLDDRTTGVIHLGIDADILRVDFQQRIETLLGEEWIEGSSMREWGSKLVGNTVRIAALLHAAETPCPTVDGINGSTMERAIRIADCLIEHAQAAFAGNNTKTDTDARYLLKRIQKIGMPFLAKGELWQKTKARFGRGEDLDAALEALQQRGYVRVVTEKQTGPGRPSERIAVNPRVLK